MIQHASHHFTEWCRLQWPAIVWMGVWAIIVVILILTFGW